MKVLFPNILFKKLAASTLLETITASVVFMIVFVMAMDTLTRLLTFDGGDVDYVVIENDLKRCRKELIRSMVQPEENTFEYEWGEITIRVLNYKGPIYRIEMSAIGKKEHKRINYRFLHANP